VLAGGASAQGIADTVGIRPQLLIVVVGEARIGNVGGEVLVQLVVHAQRDHVGIALLGIVVEQVELSLQHRLAKGVGSAQAVGGSVVAVGGDVTGLLRQAGQLKVAEGVGSAQADDAGLLAILDDILAIYLIAEAEVESVDASVVQGGHVAVIVCPVLGRLRIHVGGIG